MLHLYKKNGQNIVLDVHSGAVHIVDDLVYDMLSEISSKLKSGSEDVLKSFDDGKIFSSDASRSAFISKISENHPGLDAEGALSEIEELAKDHELFARDIYKDRIEAYSGHPTVVKALCLHVAHDCNLACKYCFAGQGEYHGPRGLMSLEVGKKALDFLCENSGHRTNLEVDFFGGEPLMNWDVVKELVHYGRSIEKERNKHFRFTLTTNGMLITDEVIDFCNKEMDNIVLSLDGRKDVHDNMRPLRGGQPSFDQLLPKIQKFASSREALGKEYYVRGTYTHFNLDFAKDVLYLADLGFKEISVEPVVAPPEMPYAIKEEDIPVLLEQYDILEEEMLKRRGTEKDFNFYHFMIDLSGGPCVYKRLTGCGSGTEYLAVTPEGDFYPCHQFVGEKEFLMGNVNDGIVNTSLREKFSHSNVYDKKECNDCFSRYYCSGGCAANAYHATGDILGNYGIGCELQRKRVECAIALEAATRV